MTDMRTVDQLEGIVAGSRADHTAAMGRLLAAERKHDRARTAWGRERARKQVLVLIEEVRLSEQVYRGACMDLALMRWDAATRHVRELEAIARNAVDKGKGPEAINKAIENRDAALALVTAAAAEVEQWKPVL
jgi:hypothetical protein